MNNKEKMFLLDTDWLIKDPVDFEHKKYILLSYLQKVDILMKENKIYPTLTEVSLHLASLQTLTKEGVTLYTTKIFESKDEELLLKDLMVQPVKKLTREEIEELDKIIKFSSVKLFELLSMLKSYWSVFYDTISFSIRKNKKNVGLGYGFVTYVSKKNIRYVWEYKIKILNDKTNDYKMSFNLIFSGEKNDLPIPLILDTFSNFSTDEIKTSPMFTMKSTVEYPFNETMIPLFKRKVLTYIFQSKNIKELSINEI